MDRDEGAETVQEFRTSSGVSVSADTHFDGLRSIRRVDPPDVRA